MSKLTKRRVDGLKPRDQDYVEWDSEVPGFGVRVRPSGKKSYILKYRVGGGRGGTIRKPTIGAHGAITCDQARAIAKVWLADVAKGGDPSAERKAKREALTVAELCDRYLAEHAIPQKKPRSVEEDRRNIRVHILPALGGKRVATVTGTDILKLYRSMRDTPIAANRTLALLRTMFNLAETEDWKLRAPASNPCRRIGRKERYPEHKRERFLTTDEWKRLADALNQSTEPPNAVVAIRLLAFTGCRRSEILTLRWEHVDFDAACLRLPESKTGAKIVYLNAPALEVLASITRIDDNPYVIVGRRPGSHLIDLQSPWQRIRREARLEGVRLHDLRHSYASVGAGAGLSLPIIGKMLGHSRAETTERYAHLAPDPLKTAVERVGAEIAAAMKGKQAEVVELPRRKR